MYFDFGKSQKSKNAKNFSQKYTTKICVLARPISRRKVAFMGELKQILGVIC